MTQASGDTEVIIIGASAAGLASAACLARRGIPYIILEKAAVIGNEWMNRYDRLRLHTPRKHSQLPYYDLPHASSEYVSKKDFQAYLQSYADTLDIKPHFEEEVIRVTREHERWQVSTASKKYIGNAVILATGYSHKPVMPRWKGMEDFKGEIIHSSSYKNGKAYVGKNVLVVGFGNSACEIAICLHEHGAKPSLSVRGPVNIVPRDIFGIPLLNIVIAESFLTRISPKLTDFVNAPLLRYLNGNFEKFGLKKSSIGPATQIRMEKKIPMIDTGTLSLIKSGNIQVCPGIKEIKAHTVKFSNGDEKAFDVIIAATGYHPAITDFMKEGNELFDANGYPLTSGFMSALPGLYFCGFQVAATGMLRKIGKEAQNIAREIGKARG